MTSTTLPDSDMQPTAAPLNSLGRMKHSDELLDAISKLQLKIPEQVSVFSGYSPLPDLTSRPHAYLTR